jgi:hypothetical protein
MWQWRKVIHKILPLAISGALIGWLLSRISLDEVLRAAGELNWRLLAPLTACMVMALYVWDSLCLKTVFALDNRKLEFGKMLRIRGISYLVGAFNYELGQAFIAWSMTRQMGVGLLFTLSRSVLLAYHDLFVLLSLGLCGWLLAGGGAAAAIGTVCSVGLVCLIAVGMTIANRLAGAPGCNRGRWHARSVWPACGWFILES